MKPDLKTTGDRTPERSRSGIRNLDTGVRSMARSVWRAPRTRGATTNNELCTGSSVSCYSFIVCGCESTDVLSRVPFSEVDTPVPIPNTEVKHSSGDGSWAFGPRKSSPVPGTENPYKEPYPESTGRLCYGETCEEESPPRYTEDKYTRALSQRSSA